MIRLCYPDDVWVSDERVLRWALDAFVDGNLEHDPGGDVQEAVALLEDAGFITVDRRRKSR